MILRCQEFGARERRCYKFLKEYFGENLFVITNSVGKQSMELADIQSINWTHNELLSSGWPQMDLGWRCGDINFYQMMNKVSQYDYYWMCEPDVFFHNVSAFDFFESYKNENSDFLAVKIEEKDKKWFWHKHASIISPKVFGCFFCLTRLSKAAVSFLEKERFRLFDYMKKKKIPVQWLPNDEGFVSTLLLNSPNFSVKSIDKDIPKLFEFFDTHPQYAFFEENLKTLSSPKIIHRLLEMDDFIGKQAKIIIPDEFLRKRNDILHQIQKRVGDTVLTEKIRKASKVRLSMLGKK